MMKSTNATPLATYPITFHISIMSTVHPPSRRGYESSRSRRLAALANWIYCNVKLTVTVMMTGTG